MVNEDAPLVIERDFILNKAQLIKYKIIQLSNLKRFANYLSFGQGNAPFRKKKHTKLPSGLQIHLCNLIKDESSSTVFC